MTTPRRNRRNTFNRFHCHHREEEHEERGIDVKKRNHKHKTDLFLNILADELYLLMRLVDFAVTTSSSELAFSSHIHNSYITLLFLSYCIWEQEHETC